MSKTITIEERANAFVSSIRKGFCKQVTEAAEKTATDTLTAVLKVYKHSADEQRKIDIEKACEWLEVHSYEFIELVSLHGVGADCSQIIKQFKKALEE